MQGCQKIPFVCFSFLSFYSHPICYQPSTCMNSPRCRTVSIQTNYSYLNFLPSIFGSLSPSPVLHRHQNSGCVTELLMLNMKQPLLTNQSREIIRDAKLFTISPKQCVISKDFINGIIRKLAIT